MTDIVLQSNAITPLPLPQVNITIRAGVLGDVPFMDSLQKLHTRQVGWMPTAQFEGKIRLGHVLIAEQAGSGQRAAAPRPRCLLALAISSALINTSSAMMWGLFIR